MAWHKPTVNFLRPWGAFTTLQYCNTPRISKPGHPLGSIFPAPRTRFLFLFLSVSFSPTTAFLSLFASILSPPILPSSPLPLPLLQFSAHSSSLKAGQRPEHRPAPHHQLHLLSPACPTPSSVSPCGPYPAQSFRVLGPKRELCYLHLSPRLWEGWGGLAKVFLVPVFPSAHPILGTCERQCSDPSLLPLWL